jgi:putative phosphoesterase
MKILVMSDTHGETFVIDQVIKHVGLVDAVFHCGDSELNSQHMSLQSAFVVRGNCDLDSSFPREVLTEVKGVKIFMTHGHLYQVNSTMIPLNYRSQEVGAEVVLFGHTHLLGAELVNHSLFVNPGSLALPRGRNEKSYTIIEKLPLKWIISFFSDEHLKLKELTFSNIEK